MGVGAVRLGRTFWGYLVASGAVAVLAFSFFAGLARTAGDVSSDFYATAATIVPVLLLALLVRIGRFSSGIMRIRHRRRGSPKIEDELDQLEASIEGTLAELASHDEPASQRTEELVRVSEEQLRRVKALQDDPDFNDANSRRIERKATEFAFATLLLALASSSIGGGAALASLARGDSTSATFALTCLGLSWLLSTLAYLEVVSFQNPAFADALDAD